jgi:hypothetical protein
VTPRAGFCDPARRATDDDVEELKETLATSKDLMQVLDRFMDLDLTAASKPIRPSQRLIHIVGAALEQAFGPRTRLVEFMCFRVARHRLVHGAIVVDGRLGTLLYAEDRRMGIISVCGPGDLVTVARMTEIDHIAPPPASGPSAN